MNFGWYPSTGYLYSTAMRDLKVTKLSDEFVQCVI